MKTCTKCKTDKPLDEFYANAKKADGKQGWCKACATSNRAEWGRKNPDKIARNKRYTRYRIRDEDVARMLEEQQNKCALCPTDISENYHIDHDHTTGEVRGLLCRKCNLMLGWYETVQDHQAVLAYLRRVN